MIWGDYYNRSAHTAGPSRGVKIDPGGSKIVPGAHFWPKGQPKTPKKDKPFSLITFWRKRTPRGVEKGTIFCKKQGNSRKKLKCFFEFIFKIILMCFLTKNQPKIYQKLVGNSIDRPKTKTSICYDPYKGFKGFRASNLI